MSTHQGNVDVPADRSAARAGGFAYRTRSGGLASYLVKPPVIHIVLLLIGYVCLNFIFNSGVDYLLMLFISVYTMATLGLSLIFGLGGMLSVAQGALVGVGAYASALAMTKAHWPFLIAALIGILLAAVISTVFTLLAARVRTHYFVLVSLAIAEVITLIETGASFTGGAQGFGGVPPVSVAGHAVVTPKAQAILGLVLLMVSWYLTDIFKASRLGRAVFVSSLNEELAMTCGINVLNARLAVAAMGGALAGLGGVLFASTIGYLDPTTFSVNLALLFLVSIVVGGMGSIVWTVIASIFFTYLNNGLSNLTTTGPFIYGLAVIVVLLIAPGGVASLVSRGFSLIREQASSTPRAVPRARSHDHVRT